MTAALFQNSSFSSQSTKSEKKVGGKVTVERHGREHMAEIGRKGYLVAKARLEAQGRNFHVEGGEASWKAQNAEMIKLGYFPNQSLQQWGYGALTAPAATSHPDDDEPPF